jgi:CheY-like chemotaxis protein
MKLPFIIIVDDDVHVLRAIQRDIRDHYRDDYRIVATESAPEAIELIKDLKLKNEIVALFISDQRMPEIEGIEFLQRTKENLSRSEVCAVNCLFGYRSSNQSYQRYKARSLPDEAMESSRGKAISCCR